MSESGWHITGGEQRGAMGKEPADIPTEDVVRTLAEIYQETGASSAKALQETLNTAIEAVLLDHSHELDENDPETADPNMIELALAYEAETGWTVEEELGSNGV